MGWFNKKEDEGSKLSKLPELPELPKLNDDVSKLPSFPSSSLGDKFSQDTIKDAVSGKEDSAAAGDEVPEASSDSLELKPLDMPEITEDSEEVKPLDTLRKEVGTEQEMPFLNKGALAPGPVFVQFDKFEDGLKTFEKTKTKVKDLQKLCDEIKQVKDEEEKELIQWERELSAIKRHFEKKKKNIFSKVR